MFFFLILSLSLPFDAFDRHHVIRFHKSAPALYKFKNDQTIKLAHSQLMFSTDKFSGTTACNNMFHKQVIYNHRHSNNKMHANQNMFH